MSRENVELARRLYEVVTRRDLDAVLGLTDEAVEWLPVLASMEGGYHGHDGVRRWWRQIFATVPDFAVEVKEIRGVGDLTLATFRIHGHGLDSRAPIDQWLVQVIEWRHGKAVRLESFRSEAEALEAVGLRE
jgi:ketosteroid isomerase-like protein